MLFVMGRHLDDSVHGGKSVVLETISKQCGGQRGRPNLHEVSFSTGPTGIHSFVVVW